MIRSSDCDQIFSQGTLRDETARVDYYTTAPAPTQWTAVGVLIRNNASENSGITRQMLVGSGYTEAAAITELANRFAKVQRDFQRQHERTAVQGSINSGIQPARGEIADAPNSPQAQMNHEPEMTAEREADSASAMR